ncbi:DUF2950 domain-containing protein [Streptomyces piniterrae]|uniref:DUF2950 domain-containing protein n=1 Tax=Streptomyces piniterrae TaxID=2571125 RepID=A0A4U0NB35_9ACTN|nr:DUF2950 domain-containing protein [Streptomyces piniterrae]TJZ51147.1 DUF2950 domain-containing protein [Streptomyces piniterrae]
MSIPAESLSHPAVRAFVTALNANDRAAFREALGPSAAMSDDGSDRDIGQWTEKEVFSAHGHMDVQSESADGLSLVATFHNETWGEMRTRWQFTVQEGKVLRFDTGQA